MSPTAQRSSDRLHLAGERLPFAMLPRWLLYHGDVNEGAKFLYCVLHDLVQGREGPTRPVTRAQLAAACGVSSDTIDRRLAQLVAVGAVEKEHQIRTGGQQANVYRVWLTPPDGLHRTPDDTVENRGRTGAAPVGTGANGEVNRSRESAAPDAPPHGRGPGVRIGAAPGTEEEKNQEDPPQPPRPAGGPDGVPTTANGGGRRATGTNPRARRTNARTEADQAETARLEAEAAVRQAELERITEKRRAADLAARAEADRLEAEASAVSAVLTDEELASIMAVVTPGMAGPLARSAMAVSRAVVAWCRRAVAAHGGPLPVAVAAGLAAGAGEGSGGPLDLPAAPPGTLPLRRRVAHLIAPIGGP